MEKEHAPKAQITIPAARQEQEARCRTPQRYEQLRLEAADGAGFGWPEAKPPATQRETPIYLRTLSERGTAITVAKELFQEDELRRKKDRLRKAEYRQEHRQEYNDYMREVMRERAAKDKEQKSPATPPKNTKG